MPPIYTQCGLRIRSEIEMPLPTVDGDDFDIDIGWGDDISHSKEPTPGEIIAAYDDGETVWYAGARVDDGYLMRFYDCGECVISAELDRVVVHRDRAGAHEILPILLAGTVTSFVLGLRGATVLHASAVEIDGRAIAFVGQSGRGKTTMAALMCADGARLVTDDVLRVDADGAVTCVGGATELRLREKAATIVEDDDEATHTTADERLAYAPRTADGEAIPLAAIVIPSPSEDVDEVVVTQHAPHQALFMMLEFPRVHGWSDAGVLQRDFATTGALTNLIPVYEAEIPWGPPFDPAIAPAIAALLDD